MKKIIGFLFLVSILLSACSAAIEESTREDSTPTPVVLLPEPEPSATATAVPRVTFTVCTVELPGSLFVYDGRHNTAKTLTLAMLQESPFAYENDELVPVILDSVPALSNGDVRLESLTLQRGQTVVDAKGELVTVQAGILVRPSGCRQSDCAITWDGEAPLEMDRMVIDFTLRDNLTWSDGAPLTAQDSVFSYQLASSPEAPGLQWAEGRTQAYTATGEHTLRWVGRPGFTSADFGLFFWPPLPSHLFSGLESWTDLAQDARLANAPLSYGPYALVSREGGMFRFEPNPYYDGSGVAGDDRPILDELNIKAIEGGAGAAWQAIQSGDCDLLDPSFGIEGDPSLLQSVVDDEGFELLVIPGGTWTQLVFGIQPASFDTFFNPVLNERTDFFSNALTRQGFAQCLDREGMLAVTIHNLGSLWPSFISPIQSQLSAQDQIVFDPQVGRGLLEEAGWIDHGNDPETPLQALNIATVQNGRPLSLELLVDQSGFHQDLAEIVRSSLGSCGIEVNLRELPANQLYAPGPDGPLFGRAFDLALLTWQPMWEPDCSLYQSWRIPTADNAWIGTNIAGLADEGYDRACLDAAFALPDERAEGLIQAEKAFLSTLPSVPLFARPDVVVVPVTGCDFQLTGNDRSMVQLIESIMTGTPCP